MPGHAARQQLLQDLDLLSRVEKSGGVRELTALSLRVDDWMSYDARISLPGGSLHREEGFLLSDADDRRDWLLPGARVLTVPKKPGAAVQELDLIDADIDLREATRRLRTVVVDRYLGHLDLADHPPMAVAGTLNELLTLAWQIDPLSREAIYKRVAEAMHPGPGWDAAAARLKAAFERGLNDPSTEVRRISTRSLIKMSAGAGPRPPMTDPSRVLMVLFAVPEPDVHVEALKALLDLPEDTLQALSERLRPIVRGELTDSSSEARRLASQLELRLSGAEGLRDVARDIETGTTHQRVSALTVLASDPDRAAPLLPSLMEALADPNPDVHAAAWNAIEPVLRNDTLARRRAIEALLDDEPGLAPAAMRLATPEIVADAEMRARLIDALPHADRELTSMLRLLLDYYEESGANQASEGLSALLRSTHPEIRTELLLQLAERPPEREAVRDELLQALVELLRSHDPRERMTAARTIVEMGYSQATSVVEPLAYDPDRLVRKEAVLLTPPLKDPRGVNRMADAARDVDRLFDLASTGAGDARLAWLAALDRLASSSSPEVDRMLAAVLATIPPDASDPFLQSAIEEIDERLVSRTGGGEELMSVCRRLLDSAPEARSHAARLAGRVAHRDPAALDFLWTLYTHSSGSSADSARRALAAMPAAGLSPEVRSELHTMLQNADSDARRDVIRTLLSAS